MTTTAHLSFFGIALLLPFSTCFAQPEPPVDPREAELEALLRDSPKQHLPALLEYNHRKMEAVFQAALKSAEDPEHRKALENSQKAWLAFLKADSAVAGWNAKGGSLSFTASAEQKLHQLRLRIHQLSTPFLQGWPTVPRVPHPKAE